MGELELIARIRAGMGRAKNGGVRVGIGDDCAVLRVRAGEEMVVTTDFTLEGRHFRRDWHPPESVGHRCLARGLSDVAAMGARPVACFLSLGLPRGFDPKWLDGFLTGFGALAERFGVELAGGDTAETAEEKICADIVVVGAVQAGKALLRSGARLGDGVYVTGRLGGAAVGLAALAAGREDAGRAQTFPEPRVGVGLELVGVATSCMDLSDGLSLDLRRLCEASGVGAEISAGKVPLARGATLPDGLHGGEDYELLFTSGGQVPGESAGVGVTRVGEVTAELGVRMDGVALRMGGWEHFSG